MKKTITLLLSATAASAAIYTNPPALLAPQQIPLEMPFGTQPPIVRPGLKVESGSVPDLWSFGDCVSSYDGGLRITHAGYVGFDLLAVDVAGWPMIGSFQVSVNGRQIESFGGYIGTDEPGTVTITPITDGAFATLTSLTVAASAPVAKITAANSKPLITLTGEPGQAFALWASDAITGPWRKVQNGNLDTNGKATCEATEGKFFRTE